MKKAASALVLAGAITVLGAGTATAANAYVPSPADAGISAQVVAPGGTVTIAFAGFVPNETVTFTLTGESGAPAVASGGGAGINGVAAGVSGLIILSQPILESVGTAGPDGVFRSDVKLPTEAGTYTLTAVGASGHTVSTTVTVDPALAGAAGGTTGNDTAAGTGLADTGADSTMLLWGAAGALALGAGIVSITVAQRKKSA